MPESSIDRRLATLIPRQKSEIRRRQGHKVVKVLRVTPLEFSKRLGNILFDYKMDRITIKRAMKLIEVMVNTNVEI